MTELENILKNDIYNKKPPATLYHYTGIDSLQKIVESKKLWASSIFHLNDASELRYAIDLLKKEMNKHFKNNQNDELKKIVHNFYSLLDSISLANYDRNNQNYLSAFVFSLSEEKDLLSQWRGYALEGKGVSIGFNSQNINEKIIHQKLILAKCIYKKEERDSIISKLCNSLIKEFKTKKTVFSDYTSQEEAKYLLEKITRIIKIFVFIKNEKFSEEKEWRILWVFPEVVNVEFREGDTTLIPYIKIDINNLDNPKSLFNEIKIGPSQNQDLSHLSLTYLLSSNKHIFGSDKPRNPNYIENVKSITFSDIPYRKV